MNEKERSELAKRFPAGELEMQEFLFSSTFARGVGAPDEASVEKLTNQCREMMRLARFSVFNWLMLRGVAIPVELVSDQTHPVVGQMLPDQPTPLAADGAAAEAPVVKALPAPPMEVSRRYFWVNFQSGRSGCLLATDLGEAETKARVFEEIQSVKVLPYAARPYLFPHEMKGVPDFCFDPSQCAGNSCCPRSKACSE